MTSQERQLRRRSSAPRVDPFQLFVGSVTDGTTGDATWQRPINLPPGLLQGLPRIRRGRSARARAVEMGKITHRMDRSFATAGRIINAVLPVIGSTSFLIGSFFFWPEISQGEQGAVLFLFGSVLYVVAPVVDVIDMQASENAISSISTDAEMALHEKPFAHDDYASLYKAQMLKTQRVNALLYALSSVCFVFGSTLFFPAQRAQTTHGAWLYLMGCSISFFGASLAASTALELKKTAAPHAYPRSAGMLRLWWWSDESAQVFSCSM